MMIRVLLRCSRLICFDPSRNDDGRIGAQMGWREENECDGEEWQNRRMGWLERCEKMLRKYGALWAKMIKNTD